jgi:hypothetical protein
MFISIYHFAAAANYRQIKPRITNNNTHFASPLLNRPFVSRAGLLFTALPVKQ